MLLPQLSPAPKAALLTAAEAAATTGDSIVLRWNQAALQGVRDSKARQANGRPRSRHPSHVRLRSLGRLRLPCNWHWSRACSAPPASREDRGQHERRDSLMAELGLDAPSTR